MIGIPLGLLYANAGEWLIHKYVLHGLGRKRKSFWSYHWHDHHKAARTHDQYDKAYEGLPFRWDGQGKEALGIAALAAVHAPLFPIAPFFTGTVLFSAGYYYYVHKRSHLDPEWGKRRLPWHVDHHLGPNQDANWCVSWPWFDYIMGTREPYIGTEKHRSDDARRAARRGATPAPVLGQ